LKIVSAVFVRLVNQEDDPKSFITDVNRTFPP